MCLCTDMPKKEDLLIQNQCDCWHNCLGHKKFFFYKLSPLIYITKTLNKKTIFQQMYRPWLLWRQNKQKAEPNQNLTNLIQQKISALS